MASLPVPDPVHVERIVRVLSHTPAGLLTDIDGTISKIVAAPERALVEPAAVAALTRLVGRLALVAAISGRGAEEAALMVGVPGMVYIGKHGMERWEAGRLVVDAEAIVYVPAIQATLVEIEREILLAELSGICCEDKGNTLTIHYRLAPDPPRARAALLRIVGTLAAKAGLRLTEGRMVLEVRPPGTVDKGRALAALIRDYTLAGVVFLGDDITDLDAIAELHHRRDRGHITGLSIGAGADEGPIALHERVDLLVDGVEGVVALLAAVTARLESIGSNPELC